MKTKRMPAQDSLGRLAAIINRELKYMEMDVKRRTVTGYWRIGRWISQDILHNKGRAGYGEELYRQLSLQVPVKPKTLERTVGLYRAYPISTHVSKLTWTHFLHLMGVKDLRQRRRLEHQAVTLGWTAPQLKAKIMAAAAKGHVGRGMGKQDIAQLTLVRGRLNVFRLADPKDQWDAGTWLDLGFRVHHHFTEGTTLRLAPGDCVEVDSTRYVKITAPREELFTYTARVGKIIDGDTLYAVMDLRFGKVIWQKLRLRRIDCPEIETPAGKRARRFVQARLNNQARIIVKTHKDTTDKWDRYLADIFYLPGESDSQKIVREGRFLNQELLDARLAVVYQP